MATANRDVNGDPIEMAVAKDGVICVAHRVIETLRGELDLARTEGRQGAVEKLIGELDRTETWLRGLEIDARE